MYSIYTHIFIYIYIYIYRYKKHVDDIYIYIISIDNIYIYGTPSPQDLPISQKYWYLQ